MFIENTEELAQNKLLLLYIINTSTTKFNHNQITEFVLNKDYMNFFLVQQYLSELIDSNFIEVINGEPDQFYNILDKGKTALSYFEDRIPENIKLDLSDEYNKIEKKKKTETEIVTEYYEKENMQFVVNLKLVENEETLFSIYLDVATKKQAELICNRWKSDTEYIYQSIIKILINENTTPLD